MRPPWVLTGSSPPSSMRPPSTNLPPSPLGQKPKSSNSMITTGVNQSYNSATSISPGPRPAIGMHVRLGNERIKARDRQTVGSLELSVPGRGHHFNRPVTREAGEHVISHGHQHGIADAGGNGRGGVVHDRQRGASAGGNIQA